MALSQKTTILLSPGLRARLKRLAEQRGVSMGHLIREAVERQYGLIDPEARLAAVEELCALSLPVGNPEEMSAESVPYGTGPLP